MLSFSFLASRIGAIFSRFFGRTRSGRRARDKGDGKIVSRARHLLCARLKNAKKKPLFCRLSFSQGLYQLSRNIYGQWWRSWTLRNEVDLLLESERSLLFSENHKSLNEGVFSIEIKVLHQWGSKILKFCLKDTEQYSEPTIFSATPWNTQKCQSPRSCQNRNR